MLPVSLDCVVFCFVSLRLSYPMLPVSQDCAVFHNPEKLVTWRRQDGEKQSKNKAQSRENGNIG
jgi:hypothetical protein